MHLDTRNDTKVYYVPGFGSSGQSQKAQAIGAWCKDEGIDFAVLEYPDSYDPAEIIARHGQAIGDSDHAHRIFVGCSLGGFWAGVHATSWWGKSVLINPATDPATSLRKYLTDDGTVKGFHDEDTKALTNDMVDAYADYRIRAQTNRFGRIVYLCADDEVLDPRLAQALFEPDSEVIVLPDGGHSGSAHVTQYTRGIERLMRHDNVVPRAEPPTLIATVSHLLWRIDPIGSCCHVNAGMEDEYDRIARSIVERLRQGATLRQTVEATFDAAFWMDFFGTPAKRATLRRIFAALGPLFQMPVEP